MGDAVVDAVEEPTEAAGGGAQAGLCHTSARTCCAPDVGGTVGESLQCSRCLVAKRQRWSCCRV